MPETFDADDVEGQREWLRRDVEHPFNVKRELPDVKPARVRRAPGPVQRSLFELCGDPARIQPGVPGMVKPAAVEEPAAAETAIEEMVVQEPTAMDRLVASEISGYGSLRDWNVPYLPRSISFPVKFQRVEGKSESAPVYELLLSTPACGDLPFVRRVEEVTGLKAKWDPDRVVNEYSRGQFYHALDLATDEDWERLASSMEHTTSGDVSKCVGHNVCYGGLSAVNGRRLLSKAGIPEPDTRACPNIRLSPDGHLLSGLGGWQAVYAIEDGLLVPGDPDGQTYATATDAGWRSIGKKPPVRRAKKPKAG